MNAITKYIWTYYYIILILSLHVHSMRTMVKQDPTGTVLSSQKASHVHRAKTEPLSSVSSISSLSPLSSSSLQSETVTKITIKGINFLFRYDFLLNQTIISAIFGGTTNFDSSTTDVATLKLLVVDGDVTHYPHVLREKLFPACSPSKKTNKGRTELFKKKKKKKKKKGKSHVDEGQSHVDEKRSSHVDEKRGSHLDESRNNIFVEIKMESKSANRMYHRSTEEVLAMVESGQSRRHRRRREGGEADERRDRRERRGIIQRRIRGDTRHHQERPLPVPTIFDIENDVEHRALVSLYSQFRTLPRDQPWLIAFDEDMYIPYNERLYTPCYCLAQGIKCCPGICLCAWVVGFIMIIAAMAKFGVSIIPTSLELVDTDDDKYERQNYNKRWNQDDDFFGNNQPRAYWEDITLIAIFMLVPMTTFCCLFATRSCWAKSYGEYLIRGHDNVLLTDYYNTIGELRDGRSQRESREDELANIADETKRILKNMAPYLKKWEILSSEKKFPGSTRNLPFTSTTSAIDSEDSSVVNDVQLEPCALSCGNIGSMQEKILRSEVKKVLSKALDRIAAVDHTENNKKEDVLIKAINNSDDDQQSEDNADDKNEITTTLTTTEEEEESLDFVVKTPCCQQVICSTCLARSLAEIFEATRSVIEWIKGGASGLLEEGKFPSRVIDQLFAERMLNAYDRNVTVLKPYVQTGYKYVTTFCESPALSFLANGEDFPGVAIIEFQPAAHRGVILPYIRGGEGQEKLHTIQKDETNSDGQKSSFNSRPEKPIYLSYAGRLVTSDNTFSDLSGLRRETVQMASRLFGKRFVQKEFLPQAEYHKLLAHSRFVLAPRGFAANSYRFYEALAFTAIPVYVWEDEFVLPYADRINWNDICVMVRRNQLPQLRNILDSYSEEDFIRMEQAIRSTKKNLFDVETLLSNIDQWMKGQPTLLNEPYYSDISTLQTSLPISRNTLNYSFIHRPYPRCCFTGLHPNDIFRQVKTLEINSNGESLPQLKVEDSSNTAEQYLAGASSAEETLTQVRWQAYSLDFEELLHFQIDYPCLVQVSDKCL
eukprot:g3832.t1